MQVNRAEQYAVVTAARNHYARCRADEILQDPMETMKALMEAYKVHPRRTAEAFYLLKQTGGAGALLEMEDVLRKAAESMAYEEWFSHEPIRTAE